MITDWEARQHEQDAVALVIKGDFEAAFRTWKESNICRNVCPDAPMQNACCARRLEGRLMYLSLVRRDEDYSHHALRLSDWIEADMTG